MNEIVLIKQLEKKLNIHLKEIDFDDVENFDLYYSMDENNHVTGLNLNCLFLKNIPTILLEFQYLKTLCLIENQISKLPSKLLHNPSLIKIRLEGNPIDPPLEIKQEGIIAIKSYLIASSNESFPLNEIRVIIVGDGGSGKTSLVKRFKGAGFMDNEPKTNGINIDKIMISPNSNIQMRMWDFGGQEIMHSTHQFFLSSNTVYILVLDGRKDEKTEYWLKLIKTFGADSPIIVVLNKIDENPAFAIRENFLLQKYNCIKAFAKVSCKNNIGIVELLVKLKNIIIEESFISRLIPKNWFEVKNILDVENIDYISYEDYIAICKDHNIEDSYSQTTLLKYLNNLGVTVHFDDLKLTDTYVLNPDWLTSAVYTIINSKILAKMNGKLTYDKLDNIFESNKELYIPRNKYLYIISLMLKFELCYNINDTTILLPDLLQVDETEYDFDLQDAIKIYFKYEFLPKSLFTRLISRFHNDIYMNNVWRSGMLLYNASFKSKALLKVDEEEKKIYIYVNNGNKRDYLAVIRDSLSKLHKSYKLEYNLFIIFSSNMFISVSEDEKKIFSDNKGKDQTYESEGKEIDINYIELLGRETNRIKTVFIGSNQQFYNVNQILDYVEVSESRGINSSDYFNNIIQKPFIERSKSKMFLQFIKKSLLFILALIGGIWTVIQIIESSTLKNIISK